MSSYFYCYHVFIEIRVFNANNVDSDQTPRSAASDLGLHCLPMSTTRKNELMGRVMRECVFGVCANNKDKDHPAKSYQGLSLRKHAFSKYIENFTSKN